jgi:hypothetical protein
MDREPDLIAPVVIIACTPIVAGDIATGLASTADPSASVPSPFTLQGNGTAVPAEPGAPADTGGTGVPG